LNAGSTKHKCSNCQR